MTELSPQSSGNRIAVFGSPIMDLIMTVDSLSEIKPGGFEQTTEYTTILGGKCLHVASFLRQHGNDVDLVGKIHKSDPEGEMAVDFLRSRDISTKFLTRDRQRFTGRSMIIQDKVNKDYINITVSDTANFNPDPRRISRYHSRRTKKVDQAYLTLEAPLPVTRRIVSSAVKRSIPVFCDASAFFSGRSDQYLGLLPYLDTVAPNQLEAQQLTGQEVTSTKTARKAARILMDLGAQEVIISRGKDGIFYRADDGTEIIAPPIYVAKPVTTVGAGDVARAAYLSEKLRDGDTERSLIKANIAGAFHVFHGRPPTKEELSTWKPGLYYA